MFAVIETKVETTRFHNVNTGLTGESFTRVWVKILCYAVTEARADFFRNSKLDSWEEGNYFPLGCHEEEKNIRVFKKTDIKYQTLNLGFNSPEEHLLYFEVE
jgi:hypothetical protein